MKRGAVLGIAALVVAFVVIAMLGRRSEPVQAALVQLSEIRSFVDEQGTTKLPRDYLISMPFSARLEPVRLEVGDPVAAGDVVARVAREELALEREAAEAELERLKAQVATSEDNSVEQLALRQTQLLDESMESVVEAAQQQLLAAEARRVYAHTQYERVRSLFRTGAQTQDDLDQAKLSMDEREYEYSQNALVLAALRAMKQATELLPRTLEQYIDRRALQAAVARRQLDEAEARYRQVQLRIERGVMTSPVDGVVLEKEVSNEQFLEAGRVLLRIGQLEQLEVEADVLSEEAVEIRPGDTVEVYGPAVGSEIGDGVPGRVYRVAPRGFTKLSSLGVEQQRVRVTIRFEEGALAGVLQETPLGVEYRVRVRVFLERHADALVIPRTALFRGADGGWHVFAVRGGRAELSPVEVGLMNDDRAEITAGLGAEELVVLAPESTLSDGDRVEPIVRDTPGS